MANNIKLLLKEVGFREIEEKKKKKYILETRYLKFKHYLGGE